MGVTFDFKRLDKNSLKIVEQHTFTDDAACRTFLRLIFKNHFSDVEQDRAIDHFDHALEMIDPLNWELSIAELAPNEEVAIPFNFFSFTNTYVINVILKKNSEVIVA